MNYKTSLLALLLMGCSTALPVYFNTENQHDAQELFCQTKNGLKDLCADDLMSQAIESLNLESLQNDAECVELARQMAKRMSESDCSFEDIMNSFVDIDVMKVVAAYTLCKACMNDLIVEQETNC